MVVFAAAAVAATLAVVADSDVVVRGTSIAEAWWSCGSDVKIENDGGAAIECARCRDGRGWMHDGTAQVALAVCSRWLQVCAVRRDGRKRWRSKLGMECDAVVLRRRCGVVADEDGRKESFHGG